MYVFIVGYPREFSRLHNLHCWYWNSLVGLILWGKFSAFSAASGIHNSAILVPPGTHHCWVGRGSTDTSTHDQLWESNPRPSDLESNALSTQTHQS